MKILMRFVWGFEKFPLLSFTYNLYCLDMTSSQIGCAPAGRSKSLDSEDGAVYRESSMYDSLLISLKSGSKSFSDAFRRRY